MPACRDLLRVLRCGVAYAADWRTGGVAQLASPALGKALEDPRPASRITFITG